MLIRLSFDIFSNMALSGDEIRANRIKKLGLLKDKNINPYPAKADFSVSEIAVVREKFNKLVGKKTGIAGRVMAKRGHGAIMFLDIYAARNFYPALHFCFHKDQISPRMVFLQSEEEQYLSFEFYKVLIVKQLNLHNTL